MFEVEDENLSNLFSIGEAARKGNVTTRTLRYYEKLGLIEPDFVDTNGYRYYSLDTILKITIIKYFKLMDFTLDDIKSQLIKSDYSTMLNSFDNILQRCENQLDSIVCRQKIVMDWRKLLEEAFIAHSMNMDEINVKFINGEVLIKYPIKFNFDYKSTILDLDYSNFIESEKNKISGAVMFYFNDINARITCNKKNEIIDAYYIQKALKPVRKEVSFKFETGMYACKYHIGSYERIDDTYKDIIKWQKTSIYKFKGPAIERFVLDYWSTFEDKKFVTELMIPIERK